MITDEILPINGDFYRHLEGNIYINFIPAEYDKNGKEIKPPVWKAFYMKYKMHDCTVDGNTGEYKLEENYYMLIKWCVVSARSKYVYKDGYTNNIMDYTKLWYNMRLNNYINNCIIIY